VRGDVTSGAGITARLAGSVFAQDGSVDLTADGQLPLALVNRALAPQSLFGTLGFDLAMRGAPGLGALSGSFRVADARLTLPLAQTALQNLQASGQIAGAEIAFAAEGDLAAGGRLTGEGRVTLDQPGLPAQIGLSGRDLRLVDPRLYDARIDRAELTVTGALTGALAVVGEIALGETTLRLSETGLGGSAPIPHITHLGETEAQRRTRIAAGLGPEGRARAGGSQRIALDLTIRAPGRVFVRGRGVDAELGEDDVVLHVFRAEGLVVGHGDRLVQSAQEHGGGGRVA
jgi:translocation and assembly module TamB